MPIMKRWTVTYTKHVKQKRKVYQDGVLELCGSGKVLLYDDCEKLIDSRYLKKDEVIESGQALTLEAHLVDIGVSEGQCNPLNDINVKDAKLKQTTLSQFQNESEKRVFHRRLPQSDSNSKIGNIAVSGKAKIESIGAPQNLSNATIKEWNALYTSQITQKAKKYHDGILRLSPCGSYMNQVTLYDEDGAVLSSKYIKSVEVIKTGKMYELPNYLVEIFGPWTSEGALRKPSSEQSESSGSLKIGKFVTAGEILSYKESDYDSLHQHAIDTKKCPVPNQVASSSCSGIGKFTNVNAVSICKSSSEDLPRGSPQEVIDSKSYCSTGAGISSSSRINTKKLLRAENLPKSPPLESTTSSAKSSSGAGISSNGSANSNKSLRDACQILKTIKKPIPEEKHMHEKLSIDLVQSSLCKEAALKKLQMDKAYSLKTSNYNMSDAQSRSMMLERDLGTSYVRAPTEENFKEDVNELDGRDNLQSIPLGNPCITVTAESVSDSSITTTDMQCQQKSPLHNFHSSSYPSTGGMVSDASVMQLDLECSNNLYVDTMVSTAICEISKADTCNRPTVSENKTADIPSFSNEGFLWQLIYKDDENVPTAKHASSSLENRQLLDSHLTKNTLKENTINIKTNILGTKGYTCGVANEKNDDSGQTPARSMKVEERCSMAPVASNPTATGSGNNKNAELQHAKKHSCLEDFPNFDLGF